MTSEQMVSCWKCYFVSSSSSSSSVITGLVVGRERSARGKVREKGAVGPSGRSLIKLVVDGLYRWFSDSISVQQICSIVVLLVDCHRESRANRPMACEYFVVSSIGCIHTHVLDIYK